MILLLIIAVLLASMRSTMLDRKQPLPDKKMGAK
jgi:hypothetical protein